MTTTDDIHTGKLFAADIDGVTVVAQCKLISDHWINFVDIHGEERAVHPSKMDNVHVHGVTWAWGNSLGQRIFDAAVDAARRLASVPEDIETAETRLSAGEVRGFIAAGAEMAQSKRFLEAEFGLEAYPGVSWQEAILKAVVISRILA